MKKFKALTFFASALLIVASCSDDETKTGGCTISNENLTGKIAGKEFVFSVGTFEESPFDTSEIWIEMYGGNLTQTDACDLFAAHGNRIIATVPNEVSSSSLGMSNSVTLYDVDNNNNIIITEGEITISSITETTIKGEICGVKDADNSINGQFTLIKCE